MKKNILAAALLLVSGSIFGGAVAATAVTKTPTDALQPSKEQIIATKQVAQLVSTQHYLRQPIDDKISARVLDMYIDALDADHTLFLQSDISHFKAKYAQKFGQYLLMGQLNPAIDIYQTFIQRSQSYLQYMQNQLNQPVDLSQNDNIHIDREKAPFFATAQEQTQYWQKQLKSLLITQTLNSQIDQDKANFAKNDQALKNTEVTVVSALSPTETLKKRFARQSERFNRLNADRVLDTVLNALLATYDPHSNYFAPQEAMELNRQTSLQLEGIGVSIRPEKGNDDYTRIETIVEGGPSAKSGLVRRGDRILAVGQEGEPVHDVVGWGVNEIVSEIRGKRGTKVTLKLQNTTGDTSIRTVVLSRDVIKQEDDGVRGRVINLKRNNSTYHIGVLDIPSFYLNFKARRDGTDYQSVATDVAKELKNFYSQNIDGLVVDLRNNPGGSLEDVARMLGYFIKQGAVVQVRDGRGHVLVIDDQDGGQQLYAGPMVVIVNLASASASEIFSAAIQDYGRGIVVGSTTTGKGTAQVNIDQLARGQMTLTQRKFYRANGGSTQNKGVIPDIDLPNIYAEEFGERKAKNALKYDTITSAIPQIEYQIESVLPELRQQSHLRQQDNIQFKYIQAVTALNKQQIDKKDISLSLSERKKQTEQLNQQYLSIENARRSALGLKNFPSWQAYLADKEAENDNRSKMKRNERPLMPEDEAYITEAAQVLLDWKEKQPQINQKTPDVSGYYENVVTHAP